jgi:hypothetical protein
VADPRRINDEFGAAVADGAAKLDRLKAGWEDARTMRLLERCRASEKRDADLAPGRDVPLWGWAPPAARTEHGTAATVAAGAAAEALDEEGSGGAGAGAGLDVAQEEALLDEIKGPAFQWSWADETKAAVSVKVRGPGSNVAFQVTRKRGPDGVVYEAECVGDSKEKHVISRCLSRRPLKMDFKFLLVMSPLWPSLGHGLTWLEYAAIVQDAEDCEMCTLSKVSGRPWLCSIGSAAEYHVHAT